MDGHGWGHMLPWAEGMGDAESYSYANRVLRYAMHAAHLVCSSVSRCICSTSSARSSLSLNACLLQACLFPIDAASSSHTSSLSSFSFESMLSARPTCGRPRIRHHTLRTACSCWMSPLSALPAPYGTENAFKSGLSPSPQAFVHKFGMQLREPTHLLPPLELLYEGPLAAEAGHFYRSVAVLPVQPCSRDVPARERGV